MKPGWKIRVMAGVVALLPILASAQTCNTAHVAATAPTSRFVRADDGTVTDNRTRLMWKTCSEGQGWNSLSQTCTGTASLLVWPDALQRAAVANNALFAGKSDWRLPNIKELASLVEGQCTGPAINLSVFPATLAQPVWSASPVSSTATAAWLVHFADGNDGRSAKNTLSQVRLVRHAE